MSVSSISSFISAASAMPKTEAMEPAGPDTDGDSDDVGAAATSAAKGSATAAGVGTQVDLFA